MLTYCSTPYLTLPEMQLDIVNETIFSYLRAPPKCHKQGMMAGFSRHFPEYKVDGIYRKVTRDIPD